MFESFIAGLTLVFQWPSIGFLFLGVVIGIWIGAVPGLGSITGLIMLLPFTYSMDPVSAFALLLGMFAVTTTSDTISSVMLGIPGTAASQAIVIDGYPLAKKGQAARAFGASFSVSSIGGLCGAMFMALSLPVIKPFILSFGSPEIFMMGLLGLALVGSLAGDSLLKGLAAAALGLLIASIGYAQTISIPRFHFEQVYLLDGLPLIPIVLGLFGIPEILQLATRSSSISKVPREQGEGGGIWGGVRDTFRHWWLAIRCSAIGIYVGMLPGLGGAIVDWIAYAHTVQSSKDKSQFGQGDIRGIIGPDAANNASLGGALIPTVAFGIPGSLGTAILLGALVLQGLKPGPEMLTTRLDLTFSMVWSIILANITATIILLFWAKQVAKAAFVPGHLIVPGVVLFVFMGSWLASAHIGDWLTCLLFGVVGYLMKRGGWPRPPLVLALVLGGIMENALIISQRVHGGAGWLSRPIVIAILILIVITIAFSVRSMIMEKRHTDRKAKAGEGRGGQPVFSILFGAVVFVVFASAIYPSSQWAFAVGGFPLVASIFGVFVTGLYLILEGRGLRSRAMAPAGGGHAGEPRASAGSDDGDLVPALKFFGSIAGMIGLALLVGQKIAMPVFITFYLRRWGGYSWRIALFGGFLGWLVVIAFYDRIIRLLFMQPLLDGWLRDIIPSAIPLWLLI